MSKKDLQLNRAWFHRAIGMTSVLVGQVIGVVATKVRQIVGTTTLALLVAESLKLVAYHFLIKPGAKFSLLLEKDFWRKRRNFFVRSVCFLFFGVAWALRGTHWIFVEWFFVKTGLIREEDELRSYSAMFTFSAGIFLPLLCRVEVPAVMLAVLMHGFGDPRARIAGKKSKQDPIFGKGEKTWAGTHGFFYHAIMAALFSLALNTWFPVYDGYQTGILAMGVLAGAFVGSATELLSEPIDILTSEWSGKAVYLKEVLVFLTRDNFLVVASVAFTIGVFLPW